MVKSRSKIFRQPVKKSKKTAARTARGASREKSQSAEAAARAAPSKTAAKGKKRKWVYAFGGGKAAGRANMRNLLGGKGAGLAEMAHLGLPVPPGFTITTEVCTYFYENGKTYPKNLKPQVEAALAEVGRITGKKFGDGKNPLLVSVRSGARASMPGMMDTVLCIFGREHRRHGCVLVQSHCQGSRRRRFRFSGFRFGAIDGARAFGANDDDAAAPAAMDSNQLWGRLRLDTTAIATARPHRVVASPPSATLTPWLGRTGHHPIKPKRNRRRRGLQLGLNPAPRSAPPRQGIKSTIPPARNLGARTRRSPFGSSRRRSVSAPSQRGFRSGVLAASTP
jgi:hypothetical protein